MNFIPQEHTSFKSYLVLREVAPPNINRSTSSRFVGRGGCRGNAVTSLLLPLLQYYSRNVLIFSCSKIRIELLI
jgi:hypothetical protein